MTRTGGKGYDVEFTPKDAGALYCMNSGIDLKNSRQFRAKNENTVALGARRHGQGGHLRSPGNVITCFLSLFTITVARKHNNSTEK